MGRRLLKVYRIVKPAPMAGSLPRTMSKADTADALAEVGRARRLAEREARR